MSRDNRKVYRPMFDAACNKFGVKIITKIASSVMKDENNKNDIES